MRCRDNILWLAQAQGRNNENGYPLFGWSEANLCLTSSNLKRRPFLTTNEHSRMAD